MAGASRSSKVIPKIFFEKMNSLNGMWVIQNVLLLKLLRIIMVYFMGCQMPGVLIGFNHCQMFFDSFSFVNGVVCHFRPNVCNAKLLSMSQSWADPLCDIE